MRREDLSLADQQVWDRTRGDAPLAPTSNGDGDPYDNVPHPVPALSDDVMALPDGFRPTDTGNAARLVAAANGTIRYVHAWQKWIVYASGRWHVDTGEALVTEHAKNVARRMFHVAADLDRVERDRVHAWAKRSEQAGTIAAMVKLARGIPGVIVHHDLLDRDPAILNVVNGTIDLRTGRLRPHDPADLLTMQSPVAYHPDATAPLWASCVERWQPDPDVRVFLQRAIGSAATGHPLEYLFVNFGRGANGKSKFAGAVANVLGPYSVVPHKSLLVASRHEGHPTHVASLFGARMLVAPETTQDDRLDEEQVKNLTGGDMLRARRMREDEWSFHPTWTAFLHTNHRPRVRGTDEGVWRRVRLIPWVVTIPADERDEHLAAKLADEASGILNWIIDGAVAWYQHGLDEPDAVKAATTAYRNDEDHVGRFLVHMCDTSDATASVSAKDLRAAYEAWCEDDGEDPWTPTGLGRALTGRGFDSVRTKTGVYRLGVRLR